MVTDVQNKGQQVKRMKYKEFHLKLVLFFLFVRAVKHQDRLPREAVESSSMEIFRPSGVQP